MGGEQGTEDRFASIYESRADDYHELVMREDAQGNLPAALREIVEFDGRTVVELGAGTGRVTGIVAPMAGRVMAFDRSRHMLDRAAVHLSMFRNVSLAEADNLSVPLPDGSADVVIEGWSFGHGVTTAGDGWRKRAEDLLAETMRLLTEEGTAIIIETLGTGFRTPSPPGVLLPSFYSWLEEARGFHGKAIRTDYVFEDLARASEMMEFFFGGMVDHEVLPTGRVVVPECTGIWWRRKRGRGENV
jgi:ubiquinone/menaquinone biosynthesis C-methylase UbiE